MNDITALAQRIPERKRHDWSQSVMRDCDFCNQWALTVKHEDGARICASCCDAEYTSKLEVANTALVEALEKAQQRIAELERMESALRPVGVMSQAAYHRLENRESRFIALWPRPEIYLPRKRPDDGVIVYARTAGIQVIEGEGQ